MELEGLKFNTPAHVRLPWLDLRKGLHRSTFSLLSYLTDSGALASFFNLLELMALNTMRFFFGLNYSINYTYANDSGRACSQPSHTSTLISANYSDFTSNIAALHSANNFSDYLSLTFSLLLTLLSLVLLSQNNTSPIYRLLPGCGEPR